VIVTAAGASAALADTMHHKLIDADLGIRTRLVGRLCNLKCFFEGGAMVRRLRSSPPLGRMLTVYLLSSATGVA
jgi:hypothetical protein